MPFSTYRPPSLVARLTSPLALVALFACTTNIQQLSHAQDTSAAQAPIKEDSTGDTNRES
jgi:hypothetical protein